MTARRAAALALIGALVMCLTPMPRDAWGSPAGSERPRLTTHQGLEANDRRVIATSVAGREIVARHYGAVDAPVQLVVIGQMHGSEPGGRSVAAEVASRAIPDGVGVWVVASMNPDGAARGSRANARGVDLNRNFPEDWAASSRGTYGSGRRAASEPETRGMVRFLSAVRPTAVLSYHQAFDVVDITHPRSRAAGRRLAAWMGERAASVPCSGPCHGTLTQWANRTLRTIAITVELDRRVSPAEADRAAAAVLRLGTWLGR